MPVYRIGPALAFPAPERAEPSGLLGVGGDLSPRRLLLAYSLGIFPWFGEGEPILWFSPDPRAILDPAALHVGRSLRKELRRSSLRVTFDQDFAGVIRACAEVARPEQEGTWITGDMITAYCRLHRLGFAHSVECWAEGDAGARAELVGGVYGVSLGSAFFGESMFARWPNASKIAFVALIRRLETWGFDLVDCQMRTRHLERFGAREVPRREFLARLERALERPTRRGSWSDPDDETLESARP